MDGWVDGWMDVPVRFSRAREDYSPSHARGTARTYHGPAARRLEGSERIVQVYSLHTRRPMNIGLKYTKYLWHFLGDD